MYTVYLLYSKSHDSFYIGFTSDIQIRLTQHNAGLTISTRVRRPWLLVYEEHFPSQIEAIRRERFLKRQRNKSFYKKLAGLI